MMASAEIAAAAQEDGLQAAETGTPAVSKPQAAKSSAKAPSGAAKPPARSVAADMQAPAVKVGVVIDPEAEASDPHVEAEDEAEPAVAPPPTPASASEDAEPTAAPQAPRSSPSQLGMRPGQHGGPTQIPRMAAKAEIFVEGDHVVYPTHGVGKVERIVTEEIAGHRLELIHITFEENRMTLRVPVAKARSAGLRKLATRKMFDDALAVLKGRARIKRTMWSRRAQEYEAKINSGDPLAIAEVVRDLHRNAGQPDQSFSERQIYEAAMDRLAAELAALDKTDKPSAVSKLIEFLKTV